MVRFDVICKTLISNMGDQLSYISRTPYHIDPQAEIEIATEFESEEKSLPFTIDAAWLNSLCPTLGRDSWASNVISDVVVAWEVDSTHSHKDIRSSIDNLATLNPRLGIELLLIGGNKYTINRFKGRFKTACQAARLKSARIIVIHDIIFSQLYYKIVGRHPEALYDAYLEAAEEPEIRRLLKDKWISILRRTRTEMDFRQDLQDKLLERLNP